MGRRLGEMLCQAFMAREEYEEEEKPWRWLHRPLLLSLAILLLTGVSTSALVCLAIVFPSQPQQPFCSKHRIQPLPLNTTSIGNDLSHHPYFLTESEASRFFWMAIFLPTIVVFSVSFIYLLAGMVVAYFAPNRHMCIKIVENNCCASKPGGVQCLAIINVSFAMVFSLMAIFLGSSILTMETDCSITLFWCYEVICWGLAVLFGCTFLMLRRKAAVIMDDGEFGSRIIGMELLEASAEPTLPEVQRRVNAGFSSWMGSSILSSDDEDEWPSRGLDNMWEDDQEAGIVVDMPRRN